MSGILRLMNSSKFLTAVAAVVACLLTELPEGFAWLDQVVIIVAGVSYIVSTAWEDRSKPNIR